MINILLTGASGFVGKNILLHLGEKFNFQTVSRDELANLPQLLQDHSVIIHLAGKAHDVKRTSAPDEYYQVNYHLTKDLYDAFLRSKAKKFIFFSSVKAAADVVDGELTEQAMPAPLTHYGKSKLLAEQYIQEQPLPEGKSYYILRPCMIHGPGNKGNLNLLFDIVKKGVPYPLAGFDNRRSFLSIKNLCAMIEELLQLENIPSGVYNIADDIPLSTTEVVSILASALNRSPKLLKIPVIVIKTLARVGDVLHLPLNSERLAKLTESYIVSNNKIKEALNIKLPLTSVEGLKITAASFTKL